MQHGPGRGSLPYQEITDDRKGEPSHTQSSAGTHVGLGPQGEDTIDDKDVKKANDGGEGGGGGGGDDYDESLDIVVENEEPGLWGPDGLIAIPHVKMVLFLAFLVQVHVNVFRIVDAIA